MSITLNNERKAYGLNLTGKFIMKKKSGKRTYKNQRGRMFTVNGKLSSTNFLKIYTLFMLKTLDKPLYGKEILNELNNMYNKDDWKFSHGTLYPILATMEASGLITRYEKPNEVSTENRKNAKRYYVITDKGKELLDSKLEDFKYSMLASSQFFDKMINKLYQK